MGRKRTQRAKKKRSRRLKGGSTGALEPTLSTGSTGALEPTLSSGSVETEPAPPINKVLLRSYLNMLNGYIIDLIRKTEPELGESTSGFYEYDKFTKYTTSYQLYENLNDALSLPGTRSTDELREREEAAMDIKTVSDIQSRDPTKTDTATLLLEAEKIRLSAAGGKEGKAGGAGPRWAVLSVGR